MGKYDPWRDYLNRQAGPVVVISFDELQAMAALPESAKLYDWWWANEDPQTTTHVQCKSWQAAGFLADADLRFRTVTFRRR